MIAFGATAFRAKPVKRFPFEQIPLKQTVSTETALLLLLSLVVVVVEGDRCANVLVIIGGGGGGQRQIERW